MIVNPDLIRKNLLTYTRIAFQLLPEIDCPLILDIGCGTGVPTIEIAEMSNGSVIGVDIDSIALNILEGKIRQNKLNNRVRTLNCSFTNMPFDEGTFDIIWAEGAVSQCGFAGATKLLGRFLKRGGFFVVHDIEGNYIEKINAVESENFRLYGFFVLSETVWWNEYYRHLEAELTTATSTQPPFDLGCLRKEVAQFKREPQRYRSAFFIMQKI